MHRACVVLAAQTSSRVNCFDSRLDGHWVTVLMCSSTEQLSPVHHVLPWLAEDDKAVVLMRQFTA
jgi:hypothetical protein